MKRWNVLFSLIAILCISKCIFGANSVLLIQQDTIEVKNSIKLEQLLLNSKNEEIVEFCDSEIKRLLEEPKIDSLKIAKLYQYKGKAYFNLKYFLECAKAAEKGILFCNNTEDGKLLKGKLYTDKASAETYSNKSRSVFNSTLNAIKFLSNVDKPDYDYLITSYRYLSQQCAYYGYKDDAKMYLRRAERLYAQNKKLIDSTTKSNNGSIIRYDVILLYSKIYQIYKYGKSKQDSLDIVASVNKFEGIKSSFDFSVKNDGIYYTTALNHIGDWYASRKPEAQTTPEDIEKALYYINKSIDFIENKGYPGTILSNKYNKVKILALSNKPEQAENLINELLEPLPEKDPRRPYFLAQKALIKAKQNQKDSTMVLFYDAISKVHSDTTKLSKDLDNFKPSISFNHTKLLLRISEELSRYFPKDSTSKKMASKLYPLAFHQFENSYDKRKFNKTYNTYLRKIIQGILNSKDLGYNNELQPGEILNRVENIQNLLAW